MDEIARPCSERGYHIYSVKETTMFIKLAELLDCEREPREMLRSS